MFNRFTHQQITEIISRMLINVVNGDIKDGEGRRQHCRSEILKLCGFTPTSQEVEAFMSSTIPLVNRLLQ